MLALGEYGRRRELWHAYMADAAATFENSLWALTGVLLCPICESNVAHGHTAGGPHARRIQALLRAAGGDYAALDAVCEQAWFVHVPRGEMFNVISGRWAPLSIPSPTDTAPPPPPPLRPVQVTATQPTEQAPDTDAESSNDDAGADPGRYIECPICFDGLPSVALVPCGHTVCRACWRRLQTGVRVRCHICRGPVTEHLQLFFAR
jgi:hypothetical protein